MIRKAALVLFFALILSACAYSAQSPAKTTQTQTNDGGIAIQSFSFSPKILTVGAGQTVTVANNDSVGHTIASDDDKSFVTQTISPGQTATIIAPSTPGSYPFRCTIHPSMTGTLIVQ